MASRRDAKASGPPGAAEPSADALQFLRALWELNHALESASRSMKKRLGVTGPERLFIRLVGGKPGITPAEVADVMHVHRSTVTPLMKRLVRRRLVLRHANPVDGRSFLLSLTPAGRRIDSTREGTIEANVAEAVAASSPPEVQAASAVLLRVARRLASRDVSKAPARATSRRE